MSPSRPAVTVVVLPLLFCGELSSQAHPETANKHPPQTDDMDWGQPRVSVTKTNDVWTIAGFKNTLALNTADMAVNITSDDITWRLEPSGPDDIVVQSPGSAELNLKLTQAGDTVILPYKTGFMTGLVIKLSEFKDAAQTLDLTVQLFVCMEANTEDILFDIVPIERTTVLKRCCWPKAFVGEDVDCTVIPAMQGMLLPRNWDRQVTLWGSFCYDRCLYMPWWGHSKGERSAILIVETPDDAACKFAHPACGPTRMALEWHHSLGQFRYPRRARLAFLKGNYVQMAKRYRQHAIMKGDFISLKEKIARNPAIERLIGSPVAHIGALRHHEPGSKAYDQEDPGKNHSYTKFSTHVEQLNGVSAKGVKKLYIHLDGWGFRGYDNLHPDCLPPSEECGDWEGLRQLANACRGHGYIFALHDQYHDYYVDAKSFQERHARQEESGKNLYMAHWAGGKQTWICPRLSPGHVKKNYEKMKQMGLNVGGAYLDVFAIIPPPECYSAEHPSTRTQTLECWGDCFDYIRTQVGVVSSEEPTSWAVKHISLVHHAPHWVDPIFGDGPAHGIPIPLFNLVYHDALITPWFMGKRGDPLFGIPKEHSGYLLGLLNGGVPYMSVDDPKEPELEMARVMCALNGRVALLEMTDHEFLDRKYRRQRTTFADGTTVTIDPDVETFEVVPRLQYGKEIR
ncbi:MAG TPA: DUF5696 domain-containing protein [Phycisphaerae bacterium]|nr:DUF5696 domain-containing protein [Phycisphaerae bacterium]HRY68330.1 DUF5696 domain-containing protein [Phycisphaerae bacterium]HSA26787.1 DUF5696 domain-containing protein [Phycisphaerae bacterium]